MQYVWAIIQMDLENDETQVVKVFMDWNLRFAKEATAQHVHDVLGACDDPSAMIRFDDVSTDVISVSVRAENFDPDTIAWELRRLPIEPAPRKYDDSWGTPLSSLPRNDPPKGS